MKNKIFTAISLAAVAAASSSAFAYDTDYTISGDRYEEHHTFFEKHNFHLDPANAETEIQAVQRITNDSPLSGGNAVGHTYVTGDGNFANVFSRAFRPNTPLDLLDLPNGSGGIPDLYNIITAANGKIIGDSYWGTETAVGAVFRYGFYDLVSRSFYTYNSCASTPSMAQVRAQNAPMCTPTSPIGLGDVAYLTCDIQNECGQLSKSVPVPAFASAVLGLGLVGLTVLSSKRRKVK